MTSEATDVASVWIPALLRDLTGGRETVEVQGAATVGQVIDSLDAMYPGMRQRLCSADGLRAGISVAVDSTIATLGLRQPVDEDCEVHFVPAVSGG